MTKIIIRVSKTKEKSLKEELRDFYRNGGRYEEEGSKLIQTRSPFSGI